MRYVLGEYWGSSKGCIGCGRIRAIDRMFICSILVVHCLFFAEKCHSRSLSECIFVRSSYKCKIINSELLHQYSNIHLLGEGLCPIPTSELCPWGTHLPQTWFCPSFNRTRLVTPLCSFLILTFAFDIARSLLIVRRMSTDSGGRWVSKIPAMCDSMSA